MSARLIPGGAFALLLAVGCTAPVNRPVTAERPMAAPAQPAPVASVARTSAPAAGQPAVAAAGPQATAPEGPAPDRTPERAAPSVDDRSVSWPRTVDGQSGTVIATVGGQGIELEDLVSKWILRDPDGVRAILDDLLLSRIVTFEAASLDVKLPPNAIGDEVARRLDALEKSAREVGAPSLEVYVRRRLGLEVETLRAELEREAAIDLLASRCVRAWLLATDRREIRAIAVDDRQAADQVQARLARGDDFAALAEEFSTDPSGKAGGRMPPVVRADQPLARAAFATDVGAVSGPIQDAKGFIFLKVEGAPQALEGGWAALGAEVEADLKARPIEDPEFWQWKDAMYQRYDIDITPFLELASR